MKSSRRYIKRVWRVPSDRGALERFATLCVKALVKHGWPAKWEPMATQPGFYIRHTETSWEENPADFLNATQIAVRIMARTYGIDCSEQLGAVRVNKPYRIAKGGHFREVTGKWETEWSGGAGVDDSAFD